MLTAEFAFFLHPVKKGALRGFVHNGAAQGHVLKALGIIIGVDAAQGFVEQINKSVKLGRFLLKLYYPLVRTAFTIARSTTTDA